MNFSSHARLGFLLVALALAVPSTTVAQDDAEAGNRQYRAAIGLQQGGQFELAADAWENFLRDHPGHAFAPQGQLNLGICRLKANQLDQAVTTLRQLVQKHPKFAMLEATYLYLGVAEYSAARAGNKDRFADAIKTFDTLLSKYPKGKYRPQAVFYRGECDYARGDKEGAAKYYAQLVEEYPKDALLPDALHALGVTQEELGQFKAAGKTYDRFLKDFPKDSRRTEVAMRRGETLFGTKQFKSAAEWFAYAADRPEFKLADHAALRQADSLAQLKQYDEAAKLYAGFAKRFPKSKHIARADLAGGRCFYLADDYRQAQSLLEKALLAGGPAASESAHWLARVLLKRKEPAEALKVAQQAAKTAGDSPFAAELQMDAADALYEIPARRAESSGTYAAVAEKFPKSPVADSALYMAAFAALGQGEYEKALGYADDFSKRFAKSKLLPDVTCVAAESELQLGRLVPAQRRYAQLIAENPRHADVDSWRVRQALAMLLQKQYNRVISTLKPVVRDLRSKAAEAEAFYLIGASQLALKQVDEAIASFKDSLAADATWRQADETLLALGRAYHRSGDDRQALTALRRLIRQFPKSRILDQAHYWLAESAYALGDTKTAADEYQRVLDGWPQSKLVPHALYGLGWVQLKTEKYAEAEKTLDRLLGEFPKHELVARARFARGTARQQLGKFAPAVEDLTALLDAKPTRRERSDALYVLGLCQAGLKEHAKAAETFESLLKEDPEYAGADKALYESAWALKASGKPKDALQQFRLLAKEHADSPLVGESLYHIAEAQYDAKQYPKAAVNYYAVTQKSTDPELKEKASYKLAWCYFEQKKYDEAQQTFDYQQSQFKDGKLVGDAMFMEGECFRHQGKYKQALDAYLAVKNPSGKDFPALSLLHAGQAAAQLKQWDRSLALLGKAVQEYSKSPVLGEILYEQGWAIQNLGKKDEAVKLYTQVPSHTDREVAARAQFMIGEIQFEKKQHAEAIKTFYQVIYGYSYPEWQANATFEAARCFEALKKPDQAKKLYQELIEKHPTSDKAAAAKSRIEAIEKKEE
ncbi:MAG: tetratricopeptide repeat protein [Pirellulales bacterium]|nr:tetratricopeptide repeat protein [Pirellulales bacterium]